MKLNNVFIYGLIFGVLMTILGLFIGLQVSPMIGSVLLFPLHIIGFFVEEPFGHWSSILKVLGGLFSMLTWGAVFYIISQLIK